MTTKIFYFFCTSCGGDTAAYQRMTACPYCRASGDVFQVIDEVSPSEQSQVQARHKIELARSQWISKQRAAHIKHRWFRKHG